MELTEKAWQTYRVTIVSVSQHEVSLVQFSQRWMRVSSSNFTFPNPVNHKNHKNHSSDNYRPSFSSRYSDQISHTTICLF